MLFALTVVAAGCALHVKDAADRALLNELGECLTELRQISVDAEPIASRCSGRDGVAALAGLSKTEFRRAMGPPRWEGRDEWHYSFSRFPTDDMWVGGGTVLVLQFNDDRCENAEWVYER